ncbi:MAG: DUF5060 domain-containing protein [Chthonomonadales bacterium]|nr:DUF5060 domain-containing protein [Chthonomonadales bacterium]
MTTAGRTTGRSDAAIVTSRTGLRMLILTLCLLPLACLTGCGGPDFTSGMRQSSFDSGYGGSFGSGYGPSGLRGQTARDRAPLATGPGGVYPMVEISFELEGIQGNPFNHVDNDIRLAIVRPDQKTVRLPAFFDGGTTWRVRYTPETAGRHTVGDVTRNGQPIVPAKIEPREFDVTGKPMPGFIRIDPRNRTRFAFDNGSIYYPVGMNVAWGDVMPILGRLGQAGGNWARIWMCHWGGANLDWVMNTKIEEGSLDLSVARKWDEIVREAEKAGIHFQMVLQHHGQYSTRVNPNWNEHPWNKANGGFLTTAGEFFVNPRAVALTQAKYRYIVARWGYSPSIMAWELFNEVEWTDAIAGKHADEVAAWHDGMAKFIRQQDPYRHLVTTSSSLDIPGLWQSMDYRQPHSYPNDALAVTGAFDGVKQDRPIFYGEIGPAGLQDDGSFLHRALWASLMSASAGSAQYWAWDAVDRNQWYGAFKPASEFVKQSGFASRSGLMPASVTVTTTAQGALTLRPGGGWATARKTEFTVAPGGDARTTREWTAVPSYLHGNAHRAMFPSLTLKVNFGVPGTCSIGLGQVARAGAVLKVSVDGVAAAERSYEAGQRDRPLRDTLDVKIPAGSHTIKIENAGADWIVLSGITLDPYAPAIGVLGKTRADYGVLWLHGRTEKATAGKLSVAGMQAGEYDVSWFDTRKGVVTKRDRVTVRPKAALELTTPPVEPDVAVWFAKATGRKAETRSGDAPPRFGQPDGTAQTPRSLPPAGRGSSGDR